jgi:hypothetical protein
MTCLPQQDCSPQVMTAMTTLLERLDNDQSGHTCDQNC